MIKTKIILITSSLLMLHFDDLLKFNTLLKMPLLKINKVVLPYDISILRIKFKNKVELYKDEG